MRRRAGLLVGAYVALGGLWMASARVATASVLAASGSGGGSLLRILLHLAPGATAPERLERWHVLQGGVLGAIAAHLALVLVASSGSTARRGADPERLPRGPYLAVAALFLLATVLAGGRGDYDNFVLEWRAVLAGTDPWSLRDTEGPLIACGPLFNALAPLGALHELGPKLACALSYLAFVGWIGGVVGEERDGRRGDRRVGLFLLFAPFAWAEIAWYGDLDVLVGLLCVAAVHARLRGKDAASGGLLGAGALFKVLPVAIVPFLLLDGGWARARRLLGGSAGALTLGIAASLALWGKSTLVPFVFATQRPASASVYALLAEEGSPVSRLVTPEALHRAVLPCQAIAGLLVLVACQRRRSPPPLGALAAVMTVLAFNAWELDRYLMVPLCLAAYWAARERGAGHERPLAFGAAAALFVWLGVSGVYWVAAIHFGWPCPATAACWATFALSIGLLVALLSVPAERRSAPAAPPG
jgi:hypothetical protein